MRRPLNYAIEPEWTSRSFIPRSDSIDTLLHTITLEIPTGDEWSEIVSQIHYAIDSEHLLNRHPKIVLLGGLWYAAWRKHTNATVIDGAQIYPWRDHDEGVSVICSPREEFNVYLKSKR